MAPWLCRTTFQRSIGEIFYHAGFEDFQPAALEAVTDVASDFFVNLVKTLKVYSELPRSRIDNAPKYSLEEQVLLSLHSNGLDIDSMNAYLKDDMERLSTKLGVVHERLKAHFAEIFVCSLPILLCVISLLIIFSVRHLATILAPMAQVPLKMALNNSSVATLLKTLMRTFSDSENSVYWKNLVSRPCPYHYISCRIVCTTPTMQITHPLHRPRLSYSLFRKLMNPSLLIILQA